MPLWLVVFGKSCLSVTSFAMETLMLCMLLVIGSTGKYDVFHHVLIGWNMRCVAVHTDYHWLCQVCLVRSSMTLCHEPESSNRDVIQRPEAACLRQSW